MRADSQHQGGDSDEHKGDRKQQESGLFLQQQQQLQQRSPRKPLSLLGASAGPGKHKQAALRREKDSPLQHYLRVIQWFDRHGQPLMSLQVCSCGSL